MDPGVNASSGRRGPMVSLCPRRDIGRAIILPCILRLRRPMAKASRDAQGRGRGPMGSHREASGPCQRCRMGHRSLEAQPKHLTHEAPRPDQDPGAPLPPSPLRRVRGDHFASRRIAVTLASAAPAPTAAQVVRDGGEVSPTTTGRSCAIRNASACAASRDCQRSAAPVRLSR